MQTNKQKDQDVTTRPSTYEISENRKGKGDGHDSGLVSGFLVVLNHSAEKARNGTPWQTCVTFFQAKADLEKADPKGEEMIMTYDKYYGTEGGGGGRSMKEVWSLNEVEKRGEKDTP